MGKAEKCAGRCARVQGGRVRALTFGDKGRIGRVWRFVTGLRATLNKPLKRWGICAPAPLGLPGLFLGRGPLTMTEWKTRTKLVHEGTRRSQYGEMAEAIFLTQGFAYDSAESAEARFVKAGEDEFIYARYGNPTTRMFEERIAALEGTEDAFATASGMAAVNGALVSMLRAGDHVVSSRALFGSCLYILEEVLTRYGVKVTFVDGADLDQWRAAVVPGTKAVFFESMSNPTLELVDIRAVSEIAHKVGAVVIVDNVFATPIFSRAVEQGADVVVYSTTKHIDGQGRALGGVVCGSKEWIRKVLEPYMKHTGGSMSPFTAWMHLNGMATLDLRCRAMADSALQVAWATTPSSARRAWSWRSWAARPCR